MGHILPTDRTQTHFSLLEFAPFSSFFLCTSPFACDTTLPAAMLKFQAGFPSTFFPLLFLLPSAAAIDGHLLVGQSDCQPANCWLIWAHISIEPVIYVCFNGNYETTLFHLSLHLFVFFSISSLLNHILNVLLPAATEEQCQVKPTNFAALSSSFSTLTLHWSNQISCHL